MLNRKKILRLFLILTLTIIGIASVAGPILYIIFSKDRHIEGPTLSKRTV